ncbi:MAG: VCBS repeat-containing protein [Acidobacteria bacterium]|nr:VCBS repeat-containing protein [Acidobacteriota bacterium]
MFLAVCAGLIAAGAFAQPGEQGAAQVASREGVLVAVNEGTPPLAAQSAVDAGDSYVYQGRRIDLRRSADRIVVRFAANLTSEEAWNGVRSLLPGAVLDPPAELAAWGLRTVRLADSPAPGGGSKPVPDATGAKVEEALRLLGTSPLVELAVPVLVNPQTGGTLLALDEIVARPRGGITAAAVAERFGLTVVAAMWGTDDEFVFRVLDPKATWSLVVANDVAESGMVEWAEPNFIQEYQKSATPNDPLFPNQWHLENTGQGGGTSGADARLPGAWDLTTGSSEIVIAVIDDGVEMTHEDLAANVFTNLLEIPGNGLDDDGNSYIDDVHGWDFSNGDNDPSPMSTDDNHGTAVAGVAAGRGNNATGVSGACQGCRILPVKVFSPSFAGDTAAANAIRYAASLADVLNNSWGGGTPSSAIQSAIQWATTNGRGGKGSVVMFASGNSAGAFVTFTLSGFPAGTHHFRWTYAKDSYDVPPIGDNTAWLAWAEFPGGQRVDFESGMPAGWTTGGSANWTVVSDRSRANEGWCQSHSAKAGTITHSQSTYLGVVKTVPAGALRYSAWVSSEYQYDTLAAYIDLDNNGGWLGPFLAASGVPTIVTDVSYPAAFPETIAVGATSDFDCRSNYSQYGPDLDVVAPSNGGNAAITTTDRTGSAGYDTTSNYTSSFGGTSSATPLASGVAGLVLSIDPGLTVAEVRQVLQDTAAKVGLDPYVLGRNDRYGYGRLDAAAAVAAAQPCAYSIDPTSTSVGAGGGTGSVAVTAGAGCDWTAVSNDAWILVTSGSSGSGNGPVGYSVSANTGPARSGTVTIAGQTFTVSQASGCTWTIDPTSASVAAGGGTGSVDVTAGAGCGWTAVSNDGWILVTSGSSGSGNGSVSYSVSANTGPARSGTITIAGQTFTVNQAAGCSYSIDPTSSSVASGGGTGSVTVTAGAGCAWTAASNDAWVEVTSGASGSGDGSVGYSVSATTGPARSGTITIAGQTFTVSQASGCTWAIDPTSASVASGGGTGSVAVTAGTGCVWNALSNDAWIEVTSVASGSGNGSVGYSVSANTGPARSGTITIAGQTFTVNQASGCTWAIDPTSASVGSGGGTGSVAVTAGAGCDWTAVSYDAWVLVTFGSSGSGNGSVSYSVEANTGPARSGMLTIAGRTFTVNQAAGCTWAIDPTSASVVAGGGTGSVAVTAGAGCDWTAVSNDAWVLVTFGSSGSGNGSVSYSVDANTGPARSGTITAAGRTFTVNQASGCGYGIDPTSASFGVGGGSGSVEVTASTGCAWAAVSNDAWIEVTSGASGSGDGSVDYAVSANPGSARSGTITIAGLPFDVTQGTSPFVDIGADVLELAGKVAWGDYDNDGDLDILFAGSGIKFTGLYRNDGAGDFVEVDAGLWALSQAAAAWGDYDNDGDLDILLTGQDSGTLLTFLYRNDGGGVFTYVATDIPGIDLGQVAWGDYDNDGDLDILLEGDIGTRITRVYRNDGGGAFTDIGAALPGVYSGDVAWGDCDNDDDLDILLTGNDIDGIHHTQVFLNQGGGVFSDAGAGLVGLYWSSARWGDYDNDGDLDIVASGSTGWPVVRTTTVYRNDGPGVFTDTGAGLTGLGGTVAWGDYDNDGDLDVLLSGLNGSEYVTKVFRNDGDDAFVDIGAALVGVSGGAAEWGDYDGDGDLDILLSGSTGTGSLTRVYRNDLGVANSTPAAPADASASTTDGIAVLAWLPSADVETPPAGLTYNVRIGTAPGGVDVQPPMADLGSGLRRLPALGNAQHGTMARLKLLQGTYYWAVQAIDTAFAGSPFSSEGTFTVCAYAIDPTTASVAAGGGTGSVAVTAGAGCDWTATSNDAWITVTSGSSGSGNGSVGYSVSANTGPPRSGAVTIGGRTFTVDQPSGCTWVIDPTSASVGAGGGTGSASVTTEAGCAWAAASNDAWIEVTSGTSGSGNGSVAYSVAANTSPARTGTITIAGQTFTVDQASGCTFSLDPTSASFDANGGSGGVAVTTGSECTWTAESNDPWIEVTSGASGTGTAGVGFSVAANVSPARTGTLTIAGQTFTVSQSSGCNYLIDPWGASVGSAGGAGSVAMTSGPGCPWTAVSNDAWILVTSGSSGSGAGSMGYSVEANVSPARTGSITIAGQTFVVDQADGCSYAIDPTSASAAAAGGTGSVSVSAGAGCAWTAVRNYAWIEVTSGASGSGSGTVGYSVATNTGPAREGTMTIAGHTFTVSQADGCEYAIDPTGASFEPFGGTGSVSVTAPIDCSWTAVSHDAWITVTSGASGNWSGTVDYAVAANTGPARTGTMTIGGHTFTVDQGETPFVDVGAGLTGVGLGAAAWGDFDGDGDLDILLAGQATSGERIAMVYRTDGGGTFVDIAAGLVGVSGASLAWGDFDADGDLDILLTGYTGSAYVSKIYRNDGGAFVDVGAGLTGVAYGSVAWGDADNDGDLDILLTGPTGTGRIAKVYRNDGGGAFADTGAALAGVMYGCAAWGDYDGDGDLDILLAGVAVWGELAKVYRNDGGGAFVDVGAPLQPLYYTAAAWGDYDGDGDLDILLTGWDLDTRVPMTKLYRNDGGAFVDIGAALSSVSLGSAAWGDCDNDGDLDILLTGDSSSGSGYVSKVYRNDGGGVFVELDAWLAGVYRGSAAWGDVDNDGDLDILLVGQGGGSDALAIVYRNRSAVANTVPTSPGDLTSSVGGRNVILGWAPATDPETPPVVLTYNVRIGTTPGGTDVQPPMADTGSGTRRVPAFGNAQHGTTALALSLPAGTYYWGVQAVDTAFAGSTFSTEGSFTVCVYSLDPTSAGAAAGGGTGSVTVTAGTGCEWTATSNDGWITVTSGASGSGTGTVGYSVAANTGPVRSGTITIGGQTFTVDQASGCSYGIDPTSASAGGGGGTGAVSVTAEAGCDWTAVSNDAWIEVTSGASGSGDGSVGYSVAANLGPARTGTITIAGLTFTLDQPSSCSYAIDPTSASVGAPGGTGSVAVTAPPECAWTAVSNDASWIGVYSGSSGSGDGTVGYWVAANTGPARSGTITIAGLTFTVDQGEALFVDVGAALIGVSQGAAAWGDYDNDGDLDILLTGGPGSGSVAVVYRNDGGGTFVDIGAGLEAGIWSSAAWGDYDNDGDLDILITGAGSGSGYVSKVYRNDGGTFVDIGAALNGVIFGSVAWGDVDNDGDLDILITGASSGSGYVSTVYRNDGGAFADVGAALVGVWCGSVAWGDYDNDGDLDILLTGSDGSAPVSKVYRNDGGAFVDIGAALAGVSLGSVAWGDVDNDGDLDILLAGQTTSDERVSKVYRNDGGGTFVDIGAPLTAVRLSSVAWGDVDNDGDLDILLAGENSELVYVSKVYRNDGGGAFVELAAWLDGVASGSAAWGDADNDGDLDILLVGQSSGGPVSKVYRNLVNVANTAPTAPGGLTSSVAGSSATLGWAAASDPATSPAGLTYNVRIGTTPGGVDVQSPMASTGSGYRRLPALGNAQHGTTALVRSLAAGTYYWSVQAVDTSFAGSTFSSEGSFTVCVYAIDPTSASVAAGGGTGSVSVTAGAGCAWTAVSNDAWIEVTSGSSGSGNGSVSTSVSANTGPARSGTITIAGQTFTVNQASGCSWSIDPTSASVAAGGGTGSVAVTAGAGCAWTAVSNDVWIEVTSGSTGTGNGSVGTSVSANTGPARSGTITIAGQTFTVNQAPTPFGVDTPGIYRASDRSWYLKNSSSGGAADLVFPYGDPSDQAVKGDWDGDGDDTVGIYRNGTFYIRNSNTAGNADIVIGFGVAGDIPIAGDWDGDGIDTIGIYRPSEAAWFLRNTNTPGPPDFSFTYGLSNETPVAGDWDGDGIDTVGIFRASDRQWYLHNSNAGGNAELVFPYGDPAMDVPVVGDWDGDGDDTVGIYRASLGEWFIRNTNTAGNSDLNFTYGLINEKPLAGDWDGN